MIFIAALLAGAVVPAQAQESGTDFTPHIHGTVRGKYEYQPGDKAGRFEVRNARFSVDGKVTDIVEYKAEIDLSDEGKIKMLDAFTRLKPVDNVRLTIGQMRVPFTIDAHRSPHQQYFANRSFIAKQVGNVRGMFNGSGLTNQKDFWTNNVNFSAKAQFFLPEGFNVTLSVQKIKPDHTGVVMYDAGAFYHARGWHVETEYLLKHYAEDAFKDVHSVDAFVNYDIPLRKCLFSKVSPLLRYDYMSDHTASDTWTGNRTRTARSP